MKNRQILVVCQPCGYKLRGSRLALTNHGLPYCGSCRRRMRYADPGQKTYERKPRALKETSK